MRAALYIRVSTRDKSQETENQLRQLREFCAAQGWPIVAEYEDHESGGKADRAQFGAMMADASRRTFDVVVVGHSTAFRAKAWVRHSTIFGVSARTASSS